VRFAHLPGRSCRRNAEFDMKKTKPNPTTHNPINLPEARRAMLALLPHLPEPRVGEWLTVRGLRLPDYEALAAPNALPVLDQPGALLEGIGTYQVASLPRHWVDAVREHNQRQIRSTQLLRLHAACLRAETEDAGIPDLADCDGVVAGLLLLVARPCLAALREALVCRAVTSPFGAYLAAHGMLIEDEHARVLDAIAGDPRIASALCRRDPVAAGAVPYKTAASSKLLRLKKLRKTLPTVPYKTSVRCKCLCLWGLSPCSSAVPYQTTSPPAPGDC